MPEGDGTEIVYVVARRAIAPGDELTVDYNVNHSGGTSWPCYCGAARCRGATGGDFFKLPLDHQLEYLPLLADWFIAAHPDRVGALRRLAER